MGSDLGTILINSSTVFALGIKAVILLAALVGLVITAIALIDIYVILVGESRYTNRQPSWWGAITRILLGGALACLSGLLWVAGDTFANGGSQTAEIFNYGGGGGSSYCDQIRIALSLLFMLVGTIAYLRAGLLINQRANGASMHTGGNPWVFVIAGTLVFFVSDVISAIGTTFGMDLGMAAVCRSLQ